MPTEWAECVRRWSRLNEPHRVALEEEQVPDPNEEYFLYQTLLGAWPVEPYGAGEYDRFVQRIQAYLLKSLHEAKVHTSWINPNTPYDEGIQAFIGRILNAETGRHFLEDLRPFQQRLSHFGMLNSLAQTLLKITAPGVPDLYQGTELWDFTLVDPDNRCPVDYGKRERMLKELKEQWTAGQNRTALGHGRLLSRKEDGRIKLFLTWQALNCRLQHPGLFTSGAYLPVEPSGPQADHAFSFLRRDQSAQALIAVPRLLSRLGPKVEAGSWDAAVWGRYLFCRSRMESPAGAGVNFIFSDEMVTEREHAKGTALPLTDVFASFPAGLLLAVPQQ